MFCESHKNVASNWKLKLINNIVILILAPPPLGARWHLPRPALPSYATVWVVSVCLCVCLHLIIFNCGEDDDDDEVEACTVFRTFCFVWLGAALSVSTVKLIGRMKKKRREISQRCRPRKSYLLALGLCLSISVCLSLSMSASQSLSGVSFRPAVIKCLSRFGSWSIYRRFNRDPADRLRIDFSFADDFVG